MRSSTSTSAAALLAVALTATACTIGDAGTGAPSSSPAASVLGSPPAQAPPGSPRSGPARPDPLRAALERAVSSIGGQASIAVAGGGRTVTAGNATGLPAWSTSKVPLVMAALKTSPQQGVTASMRSAIVSSDNAAAETIWSSLGSADQAAAAVTQVLRDNGDKGTEVPSRKSRPEYSVFGQTLWVDGAAAGFAARLPCSAEGRKVVELMQQVNANQQWGAAGMKGADSVGVKGGWGPGTDGAYLVRQLAVLRTERGTTGLMMSVRPDDGSFASGRAALTELADAVRAHLRALPAGGC